MNALLSALAKACTAHNVKRKYLVVSSLASGHQLLEALAREGVSWLNIHLATPLNLALKTAEPELKREGFQFLTEGGFMAIIARLLTEMDKRGHLRYFSRLQGAAQGLEGILLGPLQEMRMAGLTAADMDPASFVNGGKGFEIQCLLMALEKSLEAEKLADAAAVYQTALEVLKEPAACAEDALFLIPEQLELDKLPYNYLKKLTQGRRLILPEERVCRLKRGGGFFFPAEESPLTSAPLSPLSFLYHIEKAPPLPPQALDIYSAYGAANEVREVFRRLKKAAVPLDDAHVCYTRGSTYVPLLFGAASSLEMPATFAAGVPLFFTRPGRMLESLFGWVEDKYTALSLCQLLDGGGMEVSSGASLARLLRHMGIGWGRDRYLPCLDGFIHQLLKRSEAADEAGLKEYLLVQHRQACLLRELIKELFALIPDPGTHGEVDFPLFCRGFTSLIEKYARVRGPMDMDARDILLRQLEDAALSCCEKMTVRAALRRLRAGLTGIGAGASGARPGHLHVSSIQQGEWENRPLTFVLGLDSGSFPGSGLQDPVLLDEERKKLSSALLPVEETPRHNLYRMVRFLASRRHRLVLSYPYFDVVQGRPTAPSSLLLQLHRLRTGKGDTDYSEFISSLPAPATYIPKDAAASLWEYEWWLHKALMDGKFNHGEKVLRRCYPRLDRGFAAEEFRQGDAFTAYDGGVPLDASRYDPRLNPGKAISATSVEYLAKCPFAYFLRYILRVAPPEEPAYDFAVWLDPLSRGSLLHDIYAFYLREIATPAGKPAHDRHKLLKLAERLIREARERIPVPGEDVFQSEREELLRGLEVFMRAEAELWKQGSFPAFLEVPFGMGQEEAAASGLGLAAPVAIQLRGGGQVHLRGRIDRIDRTPVRGEYSLWDFKTGSAYEFGEGDYLKKGRQLQHALYALAAEQILDMAGIDSKAVVRKAGYLFPTEKGEGQCFPRDQEKKGFALDALENMLDLLAGGIFCVSSEGAGCQYCEYGVVCRYPVCIERLKHKMADPANEGLKAWKELQTYE